MFQVFDEVDACHTCGKPYCVCQVPTDSGDENDVSQGFEGFGNDDVFNTSSSKSSSEDSDQDPDKPGGFDEDGFLIPPKNCLRGKCSLTNRFCDFCGGHGLGPDQDETMYYDEEDGDRFANDDPLGEDDEHYDSEERTGMLFRTEEPGILLACKEIREQCLPIYYASNAFSWRFYWLDQPRSLQRFVSWTQTARKYAKHITELSFEGRHSVEEGIDFEVDIDLFEEVPYFNVVVECRHPGDELTDAVIEAVEQDFITVLWKMSRRDGGRITFTSDDLCRLGHLFSEAMQR